jgi:hypothetical protein
VIAHLAGIVGVDVIAAIEIEATIPGSAPLAPIFTSSPACFTGSFES